jgi:hypothetical protein
MATWTNGACGDLGSILAVGDLDSGINEGQVIILRVEENP